MKLVQKDIGEFKRSMKRNGKTKRGTQISYLTPFIKVGNSRTVRKQKIHKLSIGDRFIEPLRVMLFFYKIQAEIGIPDVHLKGYSSDQIRVSALEISSILSFIFILSHVFKILTLNFFTPS